MAVDAVYVRDANFSSKKSSGIGINMRKFLKRLKDFSGQFPASHRYLKC